MWVAVFFLMAVFLMGGGARADIQSLIILRPLAAICMGIAVWGLRREQIAAVRAPLLLAAMVPLIMILQLVPLPPAIWRSEEHTSELQSLMRTSYAVFCLKKKKKQ